MQVSGVCTGAKRATMGPAIVSSSSIDLSRSVGKFLQVVVWVQRVSPKAEGGVLGVLKDGDPRRGGVAEEELVKLEVHDVPHAVVFKEGVKVGVALTLVLGELECSTGLHPGGEGGGAL